MNYIYISNRYQQPESKDLEADEELPQSIEERRKMLLEKDVKDNEFSKKKLSKVWFQQVTKTGHNCLFHCLSSLFDFSHLYDLFFIFTSRKEVKSGRKLNVRGWKNFVTGKDVQKLKK